MFTWIYLFQTYYRFVPLSCPPEYVQSADLPKMITRNHYSLLCFRVLDTSLLGVRFLHRVKGDLDRLRRNVTVTWSPFSATDKTQACRLGILALSSSSYSSPARPPRKLGSLCSNRKAMYTMAAI